jgi:hypothetical protein
MAVRKSIADHTVGEVLNTVQSVLLEKLHAVVGASEHGSDSDFHELFLDDSEWLALEAPFEVKARKVLCAIEIAWYRPAISCRKLRTCACVFQRFRRSFRSNIICQKGATGRDDSFKGFWHDQWQNGEVIAAFEEVWIFFVARDCDMSWQFNQTLVSEGR